MGKDMKDKEMAEFRQLMQKRQISLGPRYFDKEGKTLGLLEWADLTETLTYSRIDETFIGDYRISTVWIGLDMTPFLAPHKPVIFETMIFREKDGPDTYDLHMCQERFCTLEEAKEGHKVACELVGKVVKDHTPIS